MVILQYVECKKAFKGSQEEILTSIPLESTPVSTPYSTKYLSTTVPAPAFPAYKTADLFVQLCVEPEARENDVPEMTAVFKYSLDGKKWHQLIPDGTEKKHRYTFTGKPGKWIGAKFGFWCNRLASKNDSGWMQIDWVKVSE